MGLCMGSGMTNEDRVNKQIDNAQSKDLKKEEEIVKLLLLGTGESGKSTLFKQMKILYGKPYEPDELRELIPVVYNNVMSNFLQVLENGPLLSIGFELEDEVEEFKKNYTEDSIVDSDAAGKMRAIWNDPGTKSLWEKRAQFQVLDSLGYYMTEENLSRIEQDDYAPTIMDVLQARVRTSGIVEEKYVIDGVLFTVFDVGGQRNERKKWIHCFECNRGNFCCCNQRI